jgi:hypothetical protein
MIEAQMLRAYAAEIRQLPKLVFMAEDLERVAGRMDELGGVLSDVTNFFATLENAQHMHPGLDRPRKGCRACKHLDRAMDTLKVQNPSNSQPEGETK